METITAPDGQLAYPRVIQHVLKNGIIRSPRGKATFDAGFTVIELENPLAALPLGCGRKLNVNIAAAEAVQLIGGFSSPDLLLRASPRFQDFLDGDGFHGAYGSRVRYQIPNVCNKLHRDKNTRQAVVTLWDAHLDNLQNMNDYPCTVALQFELDERERLCMNVIMRSNDVWLGLPYDMFQFTQLQLSMTHALGLEAGWYRHTAMSLHMYETDTAAALDVHEPTDFQFQPEGLGRFGDTFTSIMKRARQLTHVYQLPMDDETKSEGWYRERFASYMG